jgi:hypothetical protein
MSRTIHQCPACVAAGERGSCARLRCYCGHQACPAFASYYKPEPVAAPVVRQADERMARSWAEREEPTWLDR